MYYNCVWNTEVIFILCKMSICKVDKKRFSSYWVITTSNLTIWKRNFTDNPLLSGISWAFDPPPPPPLRNFQFPPWWGYGYFLEPHNTYNSTHSIVTVILFLLLVQWTPQLSSIKLYANNKPRFPFKCLQYCRIPRSKMTWQIKVPDDIPQLFLCPKTQRLKRLVQIVTELEVGEMQGDFVSDCVTI